MRFIIILISVLLLISCSEDDPSAADTFKQDILNTWKLELKSISDEEDFILNDCNKQSTFQFLNDNTYEYIYYEIDENENCAISVNQSGTWFYNGSSLFLTYNGETESVAANVGLLSEENEFYEFSNGNYLYIFNATDTNIIQELYKKVE
jgi:hypothetical protein